jgi:HK97 family phage major capsid protein
MDLEQLKQLLQKSIADYNAALVELKGAKDAQGTELNQLKAKQLETETVMQDAYKKFEQAIEELQKKAAAFDKYGEQQQARKSAGQLFIESEEVKSAIESKARGTAPVTLKSITGLAASAGALVRPDRDPTVYDGPRRAMRIRDLIPIVPTTSNSVEVMRQNVFTNNADAQAPSTPNAAIGAGELQTKAQSNITWTLQTYAVRTFAHWIPASRQILSDAPQLQSLIDLDLTYGLDLESDQQLLLGDGTNQNVTGLLVDAAVTNVAPAAATTTAALIGAAKIAHIRKAITALQGFEYYNFNGVVLNPLDWEDIETAKGTDGHYIWATVAQGAEERIWRVPVVITNAMPSGRFLIGDWTMGARLYDREEATIRISESHADNFVKNAVSNLAEERYAFAIPRPKAFAKGTFPTVA